LGQGNRRTDRSPSSCSSAVPDLRDRECQRRDAACGRRRERELAAGRRLLTRTPPSRTPTVSARAPAYPGRTTSPRRAPRPGRPSTPPGHPASQASPQLPTPYGRVRSLSTRANRPPALRHSPTARSAMTGTLPRPEPTRGPCLTRAAGTPGARSQRKHRRAFVAGAAVATAPSRPAASVGSRAPVSLRAGAPAPDRPPRQNALRLRATIRRTPRSRGAGRRVVCGGTSQSADRVVARTGGGCPMGTSAAESSGRCGPEPPARRCLPRSLACAHGPSEPTR
jgi:hypothetical protein